MLVTFNLGDFPTESTAAFGVEAVHPDRFLCELLFDFSGEVLTVLDAGVASLQNPPQTLGQFLAALTTTVPTFATEAARAATSP